MCLGEHLIKKALFPGSDTSCASHLNSTLGHVHELNIIMQQNDSMSAFEEQNGITRIFCFIFRHFFLSLSPVPIAPEHVSYDILFLFHRGKMEIKSLPFHQIVNVEVRIVKKLLVRRDFRKLTG